MVSNYDELDPGIRETVRALNRLGFDTMDSGDGVTKIAAGWIPYDEALPYAHVFCRVEAALMVEEATRLQATLGQLWNVQANYSPKDGTAMLVASQDGSGTTPG